MQIKADCKKLILMAFPPAAVMLVAAVLLALCLAACEWGFELDAGGGDDTPSPNAQLTVTSTTTSSVTLSWIGVSGAYNYRVERSASSSFSSSITSLAYSTSYTASGLSSGVTYYFRVTALSQYGDAIGTARTISATTASVGEGLAITGIPSAYNGKYALAMGTSAGFSLTGAESYSASTLSFKAVRIAGGKAVLPVWRLNIGDTTPVKYTGNDTLSLTLGIFDAETISTQNMGNYIKSASIYVHFYNGNASYDGPNIQ